MDGLLRAQGCIVQRQRIRDALWAADPEGVQFRLRHCLRGRDVEALRHVDGYHKLVQWKRVIHGGRYSRIIVYLRVANNNRADTAFGAFMKGVSDYGLPSRVRTDRGGENILIGEYLLNSRGTGRNSRSVHNQRIESLWRDLFSGCIITCLKLMDYLILKMKEHSTPFFSQKFNNCIIFRMVEDRRNDKFGRSSTKPHSFSRFTSEQINLV